MVLESTLLLGGYAASSGVLSYALSRVSPGIGPRLRHTFAGLAPMAGVFASLLGGKESVTLHGNDLAFAAVLLGTGLATSVAITGRKGLLARRRLGA